jgi:hypothetical protein
LAPQSNPNRQHRQVADYLQMEGDMFRKYHHWLAGIILVGVSCIFCSTHAAWANQGHDASVISKKESVLPQTDADNFLFGLGYATTGLADTFSETGAHQAKLNYGMSSWQSIEPNPPEDGKHDYRWDALDEMILEYQKRDFTEIHLTLKAKSTWGTQGCTIWDCKPFLPKPEHWQDYEAYVRAVVERYDGDGDEHDMPGLEYPVRQYEIETEADAGWPNHCMEDPQDPDRAETYLQVLTAAQRVAREAYPDVQILPAAMLFYGLFSGEPDAATISARRNQDTVESRAVNCLTNFNEEILRHPELFDAVEFHFLGDDYREIATTIRWLREQMQLNGYEKPIYPTDLPTGPALISTSVYKDEFHYYPQDVTEGYLDVIKDNIDSDAPSQEYLDIRTWYASEQAEFMVKLLLATMEEDGAGVQLASMTDFPWMFCIPSWYFYNYETWSWGIHGMVEADWTLLPLPLCPPVDYSEGSPRPVFHALRWFIANLGEFESAERLSFSSEKPGISIYAYQIKVKDRLINVLWAEDGVGQVIGEPKPTADLVLPTNSPTVTVTHVITQMGQTEPIVEVIEAAGQITLTVSELPIFVEGLQPQQADPQNNVYLPLLLKEGE